jgi:hypothetical protein
VYETPEVGRWRIGSGVLVPLSSVQFDWAGVEGQARPLDPKVVQDRIRSLKTNMPQDLIPCRLWEVASGGPYLALSGQHTARAVQLMRQEAEQRHEALPRWMVEVRATIYAREMPLRLRQLVSGGDQAAQGSVAAVRVSRVVELALLEMARDPRASVSQAAQTAISGSGYPRPPTRKGLEEWSGPLRWAMSCRDIALEALRSLESRGLCASVASLRGLRSLLTPSARVAVAQAVLQGVRNQAHFESICRGAVKDMLVSMHWREGNPRMDSDKGV